MMVWEWDTVSGMGHDRWSGIVALAHHRRQVFSFFLAALKITTVTIAMIKMFTYDHMQ